MKVEFVDFFSGLLKDGVFNPKLKYDEAGFDGLRHSLHTSHYADRLHEVLCENESDTIEYKGALYSVACGSLVSNKPFNVKGFIGDMDNFNKQAKESMLKDIANYKKVVAAWGEVESYYNSISSTSIPPLKSQYFNHNDFMTALITGWIEKAVDYVMDHLNYNLVNPRVFQWPNYHTYLSSIFGLDDNSIIVSIDKLEQNLDQVCFVKLKDRIVSVFDEDELNEESHQIAARELCDEFVNKTTHKAFDKYKLSYYVSSYSWESKSIGKSDFKTWFNSLRIACIEQGLADWHSDFSFDCAADFQGLFAGDSVVCGGVQVRVYKEHITLSLPKKVSMAIGVFINKYASDTLKRKVA